MQREIKFRAWDTQNMAMVKIWGINYKDFDGEQITSTFAVNPVIKGEYLLKAEDAIIMQFTGLKDKNGKEIYEGDVLLLDETPEIIKGTEFHDQEDVSHHKIIWSDERAMFTDIRLEDGDSLAAHLDGDISFVSDCEVIGNIFQNPILLK